jgi:hypothetical protein
VFGNRTAARELRRYRKKTPSMPTRMLLDALRAEGVRDATVLDIGPRTGPGLSQECRRRADPFPRKQELPSRPNARRGRLLLVPSGRLEQAA